MSAKGRTSFENTLPARYARAMRVVGKRKHAEGDRDGLDALALQFGGGAPKGVFRYRNAAEANRDQERWTSERVQRRTGMSSTSPGSSSKST